MGLFDKLFGTRSEREIKKIQPLVDKILSLEEEYKALSESELKGKLFKHYKVYKGSSEFDTREMSVLIDGIVSEAKALGIQTETPQKIAEMKSLWNEAERKER